MPTSLTELLPLLVPEEPLIQDAIAALDKLSIRTDVDLAFASLRDLAPIHGLSFDVLQRLQDATLRHLATPGRQGDALLEELPYPYQGAFKSKMQPRERSKTGLMQLDALLQGGWEQGELVHVTGTNSADKAHLVLYSVLTHLLMNGSHTVVWIDTSRSFDATRANDILRLRLVPELHKRGIVFFTGESTRSTDELDADKVALEVLGRVHVSVAAQPNAIIDTLVAATTARKDDKSGTRVGMVVIDNVATVLLPQGRTTTTTTSAPPKLGITANAGIVSFMRRLKGIATSNALTCFLVNDMDTALPHSTTTSIFPTRPKRVPALGLTFSYLTDMTIQTTRIDTVWAKGDTNKLTYEITRNRRGEKGKWIGVVTDDGIAMSELM